MIIDPNNPLMSATGPVPVNNDIDTLDDLDIMNRVQLIKATAPYYHGNIKQWKEKLNELLDWVYGIDDIDFIPDGAESQE